MAPPASNLLSRAVRVASERSLRYRTSKVVEACRAPTYRDVAITPWPWRTPSAPYHNERPLKNDDGHGGYSRRNLFDEDGIPYKLDGTRRLYHPLVVSRFAMRMVDVARRSGDPGHERLIQSLLAALVASGRRTGAWAAGPSASRMVSGNAHSNVQGLAISALLRLTGGKPSGEAASILEHAIQRLLAPVEAGGTVLRMNEGSFLEEAPRTPLVHILNGCLTGLFGLYDAADALDHAGASRAAAAVEETLQRVIARFMAPLGWSYYALSAFGRPYLASMHYHEAAIVQVAVVAERSGSSILSSTTRSWRDSADSLRSRLSMTVAKSAQVLWMRDIRRLPLESCP